MVYVIIAVRSSSSSSSQHGMCVICGLDAPQIDGAAPYLWCTTADSADGVGKKAKGVRN